MRRVYLFRHGQPDFPTGETYCLGTTDIPLGASGHTQARLAAQAFRDIPFDRVFCSRLTRSRETAAYFSLTPTVLEGLEEMSAGDWDGLPFSVIRQRWPDIYEKRGTDLYTPIPGAENPRDGQQRFLAALGTALAMTEGDIAVISHATVIQSLICHVKGLPPEVGRQFFLPYCACCVFTYDGKFHLESIHPDTRSNQIT